MSGSPLLAFDRVSCTRGGRLLFADLSFALESGTAITVTGSNGAGKSSLIRIAAGLLEPSSGSISRSSPLALADEQLALDDRRSLAAALGFWAVLDGDDPRPALEAMGLSLLARAPVRILSTGQRKRAALARVLASGARVWLLDEPANGLDRDGQDLLARAMRRHLGDGGAILAASHQPIGLEETATLSLEAA